MPFWSILSRMSNVMPIMAMIFNAIYIYINNNVVSYQLNLFTPVIARIFEPPYRPMGGEIP